MTAPTPATGSIAAVPDRDLRAADVGMWLFLASLVMFYGALYSGYVLLRAGSETWDTPWLTSRARWQTVVFVVVQTIWPALAVFSLRRSRMGPPPAVWWMPVIAGLSHAADWASTAATLARSGHGPATSVSAASWFVLTGAVATGVFGGALAVAWVQWRRRGTSPPAHVLSHLQRYWTAMLVFWLSIVIGFYLV